jgi:hypothetical protein
VCTKTASDFQKVQVPIQSLSVRSFHEVRMTRSYNGEVVSVHTFILRNYSKYLTLNLELRVSTRKVSAKISFSSVAV